MKKFLIVLAILLFTAPAFAAPGVVGPPATVAWNADTVPVDGYKLYFGAATGAYGTPVDAGSVLTYTLTTLPVVGPVYISATAYLLATSTTAYNESIYSPELVLWLLTASSDANSSITPSGAMWQAAGASQTFTVTSKAGYVSMMSVDGGVPVSVTSGSYTLSNIGANHTISVVSVARIPPLKPAPTLVKGQ